MKCFCLGESVIEYFDDFWFYIIIKLWNLYYLFELFIKVIFFNFMIILEGLED